MRVALVCAAIIASARFATAQPSLPACRAPSSQPASADAAKAPTYQDLWCDRVWEIVDARKPTAGPPAGARTTIENAVEITTRNWAAFLLYAQARSAAFDIQPVEEARTDKQLGAPASAAGSTSLVSKGSVPGVLAFAIENGALTQSESATTVTLRGNLVGWLDLLKNQDFISAYQDGSGVVRQLRRVSYSLTLNTSTDAVRERLEATRQQLAGFSVRVAIRDERDPRTAKNRAAIATLVDTAGVELLKSDAAFDAFFASAEYTRRWFPETVDLLADPSRDLTPIQIQRILYQRIEALRRLLINRIGGFDDEVANALLALQAYDKARARLFDAIQKRPLIAVEYVNTRTTDLPDASMLRLIAEGQWGPRLDLTANLGWTFQHSGSVLLPEPKRVGGLRDFQAAAQMDMPLGSTERRTSAGIGIGTPVLGVAYLSQKVTSRAAVSFGGQSFMVDPGWIHVLQARLTIPVKGSGVKIPISMSVANRTELLNEREVRGQLGLTFDLDVLSAVVGR